MKAVMVLEWDDPTDPDLFQKVAARLGPALDDNHVRPTGIHLAIREVAEQVLEPFQHPIEKEEDEMGLTKHGEGSIIPESDQQKTAAKEGGQMTAADAEALRRENEEADGGSVDPGRD